MAEKKKTKSQLETVKDLAAQEHSDIQHITNGRVEGSKNIGEYAVATKQGLFFYLYEKNEINPITHIFWKDVKEIKVDFLAMRTNLTLNGQNYRLVNEGKKIFELAEEKSEAKITKVNRKWHQKILGFRSVKGWKMFVAAIVYLLLMNLISSVFTEGEETSVETEETSSEEIVTKEVISDEQKAIENEEELKRIERLAIEEEKKKAEEKKIAAAKEKAENEKKEKEEAERINKEEAERINKEEAAKEALANSDKDCGDFASHGEVLAYWYENGYSAENDPHDLDADNNGTPCEISQSEIDTFNTNDNSADTLNLETPSIPSSVYYDNCTAVRNAGADPIHIGELGYGSHLDRDGDGIGCE